MNFREKIAYYCLGNYNRSHFPNFAQTAIEEGFESESILILASMSDRENVFELQQYFDASLRELNISLPSKYLSAQILLIYYLNTMIDNPICAYDFMIKIDNEIMKQVDWASELAMSKTQYVGQELGLEKIYTWYRELQDFEDGSMLLYYNNLSRNKQKEKLIEELIAEAKIVKDKIELELNKQPYLLR